MDKQYEDVLGCNTVNRMYITPLGDVLVCPYVHIKIGNIYEKSLREIKDYGFSINRFRNYNSLCLAGEDKEFNRKYMQFKGQSIFNPVLASDVFNEDDFVKDSSVT